MSGKSTELTCPNKPPTIYHMKYQDAIREVYKVIVDVEAGSEQEAKELAAELLMNEDLPQGSYETTLPDDEWKVWEA